MRRSVFRWILEPEVHWLKVYFNFVVYLQHNICPVRVVTDEVTVTFCWCFVYSSHILHILRICLHVTTSYWKRCFMSALLCCGHRHLQANANASHAGLINKLLFYFSFDVKMIYIYFQPFVSGTRSEIGIVMYYWNAVTKPHDGVSTHFSVAQS